MEDLQRGARLRDGAGRSGERSGRQAGEDPQRQPERNVRRAIALSSDGTIHVSALEGLEAMPEPASSGALEPGLTLRDAEKELLTRTLEATGGNRTRAAAMLGISLRTIRNKIREYGLPPREAI